MTIDAQLTQGIHQALTTLYQYEMDITLQATRKDFEGSHTFVVFPLVKALKKSPAEIGQAIGDYLVQNLPFVAGFNVVQGFLNIVLTDQAWISTFQSILDHPVDRLPKRNASVMVEYSSPNTNKPLHLGHLRNNFLGHSMARILEANGWDVVKACLVNDRGIHICKSMIAYARLGNGETPESSGIKGDHLAGKYYVLYDQLFKKEVEELVAQGIPEEEAKKKAPILLAAQDLLVQWEQQDPEVISLWKKMNGWVYDGFKQTYDLIGVDFDTTYYESDTYLLGKELVEEGLAKGVFYQKPDQSVWIDLTEEGLDHKLVLRGDGTSVYMTQDLGTTDLKFADHPTEKSIWVVGNEQDYHFQVLFAILKRLGRTYADGCYHLSYGMVDLPTGKMKSREGTVVDADDLVKEMIETAEETTRSRGKIDDFSPEEASNLFKMLALGALKYFLLKVEPKKRMLFNPQESIDFQGNTGPFIQYTHARIQSILRKAQAQDIVVPQVVSTDLHLTGSEVALIQLLNDYPNQLAKAGLEYAPSILANYAFDVAKQFNSFYAECSVLNEANLEIRNFRLALIDQVAKTLKKSMYLLGVNVPERM
ncbi:MAG: arginine--tRNA ligase [Spirosomataceae bacterium]